MTKKLAPNRTKAEPFNVRYERVDIARIKVSPDRLRKLDLNVAEAIAHSYGLVGQLQPIRVAVDPSGNYHLDIGLHRLEAGKIAEWTHVDAGVIDIADLNAHQRRLQEIFENLIRPRYPDCRKADRA